MADKNFVVKAVYTVIPSETETETETETEAETDTETEPAPTDTDAPVTEEPTVPETKPEDPTQAPESSDVVTEDGSDSATGEPDEQKGGCASVVGGSLALILGAVAAAAVVRRKH